MPEGHDAPPPVRRKLIEVALPLDAINAAAAREKSIRHGHPSTLHLWWARRPLAAARAVIFAQLVDDPSAYVDVLLSDPALRRRAQRELSRRRGRRESAGADGRPTAGESAGAAARDDGAASPAGSGRAADRRALGEAAADLERERLFRLIEELVRWENTTNDEVLDRARAEIWQSWRRACAHHADHPRAAALFDRGRLPAFHDPFAGGGSLPLEAQRLGLEAHASDLNPVAVLINKAMIEVPPRFAGRRPVNPTARTDRTLVAKTWRGVQGLAEDVHRYGRWMRDEVARRIGHLYPPVEITPALAAERPDLAPYAGRKLTVIAWLWARTVRSANPAFADVDVPLASTFMLSTKRGKEAYVEPVVEGRGYRFAVRVGTPADAEAAKRGTKLARGANFRCVMSGTPIAGDYIKAEGRAGRLGARLLAIVAAGDRGRVYLTPNPEHEAIARRAAPAWRPEGDVPARLTGGTCVPYGLSTWGDLFTPRQLVALTTFSDLVAEARERIQRDCREAWRTGGYGGGEPSNADGPVTLPDDRADTIPVRMPDRETVRRGSADGATARDANRVLGEAATASAEDDQTRRDGGADAAGLLGDDRPLREGGTGAAAYAEAVSLYLAFAVDKVADRNSSICAWASLREHARNTFGRQALPMVWDFAESNPLSDSSGNFEGGIATIASGLGGVDPSDAGNARQLDARVQRSVDGVISTDPPYYDNIGYADLSDFFYVWLRRSLKPVVPELFTTLAVPKAEELVATPYRHGGRERAEIFFLDGMTQAMRHLAKQAHPAFPTTIYYAFKQSERRDETGIASTGWETFLDAVVRSGFAVTGTWPMRTELSRRMVGQATNALASSIVLVCRRRPADAPTATRRELVTALRAELPPALRLLQSGNIAPVDLAQAAIGPGMAVYTRYARVLDAAGRPVTVREALALINELLDEVLAEQGESDFDADSRWALAWFEQHGFDEGGYGDAETLAKAKNTSVAGLADAGVLASRGGRVRLLAPKELAGDWDPAADARLTAWETVHQLIRVLEADGETAAARLVGAIPGESEVARELCYRLYTVSERRKRAAEALSYNALVQSWPEIARLARAETTEQGALFDETDE